MQPLQKSGKPKGRLSNSYLLRKVVKGAVMQIEKALINDRLRVFKSILKISHSNYLQFYYNLPMKFTIFLKISPVFNSFFYL